ncbi:MAG: hypothetical protein ACE5H9_08130 [Anaerolineae bacterium]
MSAADAIPMEEQLAILDELIAALDDEIQRKEAELALAQRVLKIKMVKIGALEAAALPVLAHLTENEASIELTIQRLTTEIDQARQLLDAYEDRRDLLMLQEQA